MAARLTSPPLYYWCQCVYVHIRTYTVYALMHALVPDSYTHLYVHLPRLIYVSVRTHTTTHIRVYQKLTPNSEYDFDICP